MICLDTDIIIELLKGNASLANKTKKHKEVVTTTVNVHELLVNVKQREERLRIMNYLNDLRILNMNKNSALISSNLFRTLKLDGKEIGHHDTMIAGIMKANKCFTLITKNKKHFDRIRGIGIIAI